jgi:hypothetical protein
MAHAVRFGAMFAATRGFHIGAFVSTGKMSLVYDNDESYSEELESYESKVNQDLLNYGASLKAGGVAGRAFLAFALDIGVATTDISFMNLPAQHGLWLHPAFNLDVMAVRQSPVKVALHFTIGPAIMITGGDDDLSGDFTSMRWNVLPMVGLGGNFGG